MDKFILWFGQVRDEYYNDEEFLLIMLSTVKYNQILLLV